MKICRVITPGLLTTVQDSGRFGFQQYGVPVSGAMDNFAFVASNLLVGNRPNDACLEITLLGPVLELLNQAQIAITGADLSPTLNHEKVAGWETFDVYNGDELRFGQPRSGCRAYLSVKGGIDVPVLLSSRSTYIRSLFGGYKGRQLKAGDVIEANQHPFSSETLARMMPHHLIPSYEAKPTIEVVLGPQSDFFTNKTREVFLSNTYTVTADSDRMGYRLDGPELVSDQSLDMISDAIPVGAIQVPTDGKPIIMMRDAQTTGGYPKIAVVTTPDTSRLGQIRPGNRIQFSKISPSKAQKKLQTYRHILKEMTKYLT
ncbi:MAG: biotin-dependent carboxyltransferase family protein [Candidatus Bathyarchaeota archaeon]|nr:biotin-dependent carboxyltransferase family protein [Candidatus Bathyarchaeota archaeon]